MLFLQVIGEMTPYLILIGLKCLSIKKQGIGSLILTLVEL